MQMHNKGGHMVARGGVLTPQEVKMDGWGGGYFGVSRYPPPS
jgi:hypothetical protein